MYSLGPLHIIEQKQGNQLEPTYSSSVRIRDVALRTFRKRWTVGRGGERGSGISVLMARQDDDEHFSRNNITELKELIYAEAKLVCDEIGVPLKDRNRNWMVNKAGNTKTKSESTSKNA